MTELEKEVLQVYRDTSFSPFDSKCNMTFMTFMLANYTEDAIESMFPNLYKQCGGTAGRLM